MHKIQLIPPVIIGSNIETRKKYVCGAVPAGAKYARREGLNSIDKLINLIKQH